MGDAAARLKRLLRYLASEAERCFFRAYRAVHGADVFERVPALISQVYLHYDPYTQERRRSTPGRCRGSAWTFLMLLPQDSRIVIEIDGKHYYANDAGQAQPRAVPLAVAASCRRVARPCTSQAGAVRAAACVLVNAAVAGHPGAGAARSQVRGRWCPGR